MSPFFVVREVGEFGSGLLFDSFSDALSALVEPQSFTVTKACNEVRILHERLKSLSAELDDIRRAEQASRNDVMETRKEIVRAREV